MVGVERLKHIPKNETIPKKTLFHIKSIMETAHLEYKDFTVPLIVEYGIGNHWGESH